MKSLLKISIKGVLQNTLKVQSVYGKKNWEIIVCESHLANCVNCRMKDFE